jgi:hypothetical protein
MRELNHQVDFCVVGGGLSGLCAAVAAARQGIRTALVHDRPVLGGNASSEIRMWICGAEGKNNRETGLVEEVSLENNYRNPGSNFSIWDSVLYQLALEEKNLSLFLNCSVNSLEMSGNRIVSVRGWQGTAETWQTIKADLFADCSGDSILAPLSGADYRIGREAAEEFDESLAHEVADSKTMGMSCLIQARETDSPKEFIAPRWARKIATDSEMNHRGHDFTRLNNFWWMELGGDVDSIHDTESLRDELLALAFGVWDHIKNYGDHGADNWELEWVGFLPGKRESRRCLGDHILSEKEVLSGGKFTDVIAYGGWPIDDHHPGGFNHVGRPNRNIHVPGPYGIPYRCLYSRNIDNLFFAGRNISATHIAMSSTRVMATCSLMGQAVGIAAALAVKNHCNPRGVYQKHIEELQQLLLDNDCYLPRIKRRIAALSAAARLTSSCGNAEALRNGIDRPVETEENSWCGKSGDFVEYDFGQLRKVQSARLVFDSDLNRKGQGICSYHWEKNILSNFPLHQPPRHPPASLIRSFRLEARQADGTWQEFYHEENNYQRLVRLCFDIETDAVRLIPESTWGAEDCRVFAFELA